MKKILAIILVVIVAVAAFTPCCTADDCREEPSANAETKQQEGNDDGGCSPFFACTGCPGFTLVEKPITLPVPAKCPPHYVEPGCNFVSSSYACSPWQPPKAEREQNG